MAKAPAHGPIQMPRPPVLSVLDLEVQFRVPMYRPLRPPKGVRVPLLAQALFGALAPLTEGVVKAVDGVTFFIDAGETLGLVGESGCGKSSTGRAIVDLEKKSGGTVEIDGVDLDRVSRRDRPKLRRRTQMVFQDPYASLDPRMTIGEAIGEPLRAMTRLSQKERDGRVRELMHRCGLNPSHLARYPHEFSGGQRQRVAIARALAPAPRLLIADEPVSALDVSVQAQIVNLLLELQAQLGLSMLFIAHDLAVVRHISHRIAVMYFGRIVEMAAADTVTDDPLHPYTRALLEAVPLPDPEREREREFRVLEGDVPSPLFPPAGCAFHPRCPEATDRCRTDEPLLKIGKLDRPVACHVAHGEG